MKRKFTKMMAALALLVGLMIPLGMWGQAPVGTTLWAEDFSGYDNNTVPSGEITNSHSGTTVYGGVTLTYACVNGGSTTQTYTSGGPNGNSNLLISKGGGSFTISGISTGEASELTVTYAKSGSGTVTISSSTDGVTISGSTITTGGASTISITFTNSTNSNLRFDDAEITVKTAGGGQQLTPSDLALADAPVELEFDLYDNANAQTLSYTSSSTGAVTVSQSNYITATVNANNTITVTPVAVTNGAQTITINQAADDTYATGSVTFTVDIEDSTPFTGGDVTFDATVDKGTNSSGSGSITKKVVTFACTSCNLSDGVAYRLYSGSTTTISTTYGSITQIAFTMANGYASTLLSSTVGTYSDGTWTGNATSVAFSASAQARVTEIIVTVAAPVTIATPTFNPEGGVFLTSQDVEISCATDGVNIYYTTDGSNPDANSSLYNGAISISTTTTLKAIAIKNGESSYIGEATYTFPEVITIATARALSNNEYALVQGVVTFIDGRNVYVQDATAGICLYLNSETVPSDLTIGDMVKAYGKKTVYHGLVELGSIDGSDANMFVISSTGNELPLAVKTTAEILEGAAGDLQSTRVKIEGAEIGEINTSGNTPLTQGSSTVNLYKIPALAETIEEGDNVDVIGVIGYYDAAQIRVASADDVVEVQVQHNEYTLTVSNLEHVTTYVFNASDQNNALLVGEGTVDIYDGTQVLISVDEEEGYVIESLIVDGDNVTSQIEDDAYTFTMPTHAVTITATAVEVVPPTPGTWVLTDLADLTEDDIFVIVGTYDVDEDSYAMSNDKGTSAAPEAVRVTIVDNTLSEEPAANIQWNVSGNATDGYVFYPNGDNTKWLYITSSNAKCYVGTNESNSFKLDSETGYLRHVATEKYIGIYNTNDWRGYNPLHSNIAGQTFAFYKKVVEPVSETFELPITADQWYLIASPIVNNVNPVDAGLITFNNTNESTYALYSFDQTQGEEWRNYKAGTFDLVNGMGYLYANQTDCTLTFTGTTSSESSISVSLVKDDEVDLPGYNLVGNPFAETAYIDRPFYRMNSNGTGIITEPTSGGIEAMEGVFVIADEDSEELEFTTTEPEKGSMVALNLSKDRGSVIDRVIVSMGEGRQLPKFQLFENSTKVYIPQNGKDYAVVSSEGQGELPVNFSASENGTYTLSMDVENMDMNYFHLIDNMTGMDIDLLQTPSYTFEANTRDYESRFRLVFAGASTGSATDDNFAFFSNGNLIINNDGNATLQVIDITGRILSSENVNGSVSTTLNATPGVYMLRLINGENVKVQKIVVR